MGIYAYAGESLTVPGDRPMQLIAPLKSRAPGTVRSLEVKVKLRHTCASDITLWLRPPQGPDVLLCNRRGGATADIVATFTDAADISIVDGRAPITSRYRPEQPLSRLNGAPAAGEWQLVIEDRMAGDGGWLESWAIDIDNEATPFEITLAFKGEMPTKIRDSFRRCADRWSEVIVGDLPSARLSNGIEVDDVLIYAQAVTIDGKHGVLGQAGPTHLRMANNLPIAGTMEFDTADLLELFEEGLLDDTITHEMGHVLGFGTLWHQHNLVRGSGSKSPVFVGQRAMAEYARLRGLSSPTPIPIETEGGPGTAEGHWSESVFDNELMTGWLDSGANPMSRLTIASMADLGYVVDMSKADLVYTQVASPRARRTKRCMKVIRPPMEAVF